MKHRTRVALVGAGYLLALAAAWVAGWAYDVGVSQLPYDTSGGMYAAGEALTGLAAFFGVALPTTLLALWFLRPVRSFWRAVAVLSLVFAGVGLFAVLARFVLAAAPPQRDLWPLELIAIAQLLGVPLWTAAFALFAAIAPTRALRRMLLGAVGVELAIGVLAAIHWFVLAPSL